jgi:hypothetical protein
VKRFTFVIAKFKKSSRSSKSKNKKMQKEEKQDLPATVQGKTSKRVYT